MAGVSMGIQNPAVWSIFFSDGTTPEHDCPSFTKWGSDAVLVPYPDETEGFDFLGQVILISAKSEKKKHVLHSFAGSFPLMCRKKRHL